MDKREDRDTTPRATPSASHARTLAQAVEAYSERFLRLGAEIVAIPPGGIAELPAA